MYVDSTVSIRNGQRDERYFGNKITPVEPRIFTQIWSSTAVPGSYTGCVLWPRLDCFNPQVLHAITVLVVTAVGGS